MKNMELKLRSIVNMEPDMDIDTLPRLPEQHMGRGSALRALAPLSG